jgi:hypothetical protein
MLWPVEKTFFKGQMKSVDAHGKGIWWESS